MAREVPQLFLQMQLHGGRKQISLSSLRIWKKFYLLPLARLKKIFEESGPLPTPVVDHEHTLFKIIFYEQLVYKKVVLSCSKS